ncbi:alpha/beta hydrolase [Nocardia elegans]|uniref:alpha/beta fold hydrolase n=1 Tax=Nocardia elegans TaxID=300029 RepID=UPI0018959F55|nr:alpha/beta hydrolase [Nocardia elegans]MBF6245644.1 alpha/beta hydrolase [Nocardia elegans]
MDAETSRAAAGSLSPFTRMAFAALPQRPVRPHSYFSVPPRELLMDSEQFGRIRIHFREFGAGEPLLLVHGLMTAGYSWRYVLEGLGAHFRLIIPDLPGAGRSEMPAGRLSAGSLSLWIGEFQAALGLRGCAAVGNSLGGYLCMRHALADPGAYSKLVNIHSPAFPMPRLYALHAALSVPGIAALLSWWVRRDPASWAHRTVHYYDETVKSLEEVHEYGLPLESVEGTRAFVSYLRDVMNPRDFSEFASILMQRKADGKPFPIPLQLIFSRRDPMVPPSVGDKLSTVIADAQMHWLDRSSHFAHVDRPDEVTHLVSDFLGR